MPRMQDYHGEQGGVRGRGLPHLPLERLHFLSRCTMLPRRCIKVQSGAHCSPNLGGHQLREGHVVVVEVPVGLVDELDDAHYRAVVPHGYAQDRPGMIPRLQVHGTIEARVRVSICVEDKGVVLGRKGHTKN